jgi:hypothetical protein
VAADGPRVGKDGEAELCTDARNAVLCNIDWPCEVRTLFREQNLGCKMAVSSAITWFFEHVEEGIILEDDTVPSKSFFTFCATLLAHYRYDCRVSFISGTSLPQTAGHVSSYSYYFSKFSVIWGWATWKEVWEQYDVQIRDWQPLSNTNWLLNTFYGNEYFAKGFKRMFNAIAEGYDTWDFQLFFLNLRNQSFNIHPVVNMVSNIGFDERATHTHTPKAYTKQPVYEITDMVHPSVLAFDIVADTAIFDMLYKYDNRSPTFLRKLLQKIQFRLKMLAKQER